RDLDLSVREGIAVGSPAPPYQPPEDPPGRNLTVGVQGGVLRIRARRGEWLRNCVVAAISGGA
ncbi:MAG: hypothetical protein PVJ27_05430, partial [Candidatus Brocadiaceae bacterium]